jgi:hypothetical protein
MDPETKSNRQNNMQRLDIVIRWWSDPVVRIDLSVHGFVLTVTELSRMVYCPSRAAPELYVQKGHNM